jgi:hypothetical protein
MVCVLIVLAVVATFADPGWAGEGVIEINQASVLAGGGFPFTITQSGRYVLTGDLVVPDVNTSGIVITGKSVTFDLGGFGIRGPVTCSGDGTTRGQNTACSASGSGVGITVNGGTAVLRNGFVRGMGSAGLSIDGSLSTIIERVVVEENAGDGINLHEGRVVDSAIRFNGGGGVEYCDCGGGGNNQIEHNVVERNRGAGIHTGKGTVKENFIFFNGGDGVRVLAAGGNAANLVGNTIQSNSGNGINASGGVYRDNMLRSNLQTSGHQVVGTITDGGGNSCSPAC